MFVPVPAPAKLTFTSLEITEERLRHDPDDHRLASVRLSIEYADGRVLRNLTVQVWHALAPGSGGIVRVIAPVVYHGAIREPSVVAGIEAYYRRCLRAIEQRPNSDADRSLSGLFVRGEPADQRVSEPHRAVSDTFYRVPRP